MYQLIIILVLLAVKIVQAEVKPFFLTGISKSKEYSGVNLQCGLIKEEYLISMRSTVQFTKDKLPEYKNYPCFHRVVDPFEEKNLTNYFELSAIIGLPLFWDGSYLGFSLGIGLQRKIFLEKSLVTGIVYRRDIYNEYSLVYGIFYYHYFNDGGIINIGYIHPKKIMSFNLGIAVGE